MPDLSPYVPSACLPGLLASWVGPVLVRDGCGEETAVCVHGEIVGPAGVWNTACPDVRVLLDARRWEARCLLARRIAEVLSVPVGATAPEWWYWRLSSGGWALGSGPDASDGCAVFPRVMPLALTNTRRQTWHHVPALADIPLRDHPDRDALALRAVAVWLGAEVASGRIVPAEVTP